MLDACCGVGDPTRSGRRRSRGLRPFTERQILGRTVDAQELYSSLIDAYQGDVAAGRDARERLVLAIGRLATELELGGVTGYLYNVSPEALQPQARWTELREVVAALRLIGAHVSADAFDDVLPQLEADKPDDGTWGSFLESRDVDVDRLNDRLEDTDALWDHLSRHLEAGCG